MNKSLAEYVDLKRANVDPQNYIGAPEFCDFCRAPFSTQQFLVDGALQGSTASWGNMCESCFASKGKGIGWGIGQLYFKQPNGAWLLVGGFR